MENASKALLIAGAVLLAIMTLTVLLMAVNGWGAFGRTKSSVAQSAQVAQFNRDFERYTEDEIKGTDIVSIISKIIDYNKNSTDIKGGEAVKSSTVDYSKDLTLYVNGLKSFNEKYANSYSNSNLQLFNSDTLVYKSGDTTSNTVRGRNNIVKRFDDFKANEDKYGIATLKQLSSIVETAPASNGSRASNNDKIKAIQNAAVNGKIDGKFKTYSDGTNGFPSLDVITQYTQYSEFKSSKFKATEKTLNPSNSNGSNPEYYENGQIKSISFEFVD